MRRSLIISFFCSVLLGFSISMPAQNLPALQKDASVTHGELANGISYYLVTNPSMKGVADFALVRKGLCDTLAAREELTALPHFNKTVPYKFLSRKGIGCRPEGYVSYRDDVTIFRFDDVPMFDAAAADTTLLMLFDIIAAQPCKHAVIVSGDIKASDIMEKMNVFSLMVPSRNPSYTAPEYSWTPSDNTSWSFESSRQPSVEVDFRSQRTPAAQMNTIQPFISELFSKELGEVVKNRLREAMLSRQIRINGMEVNYEGSADVPGDEHFRVRIEMPESQLIPASMALASTLAGIGTGGVGIDEYRTVRESVLQAFSKAQTNDDIVKRCISAYLFGADLATPATKAKFFSSRNMTLDSELKLFNGYISALLADTQNSSVRWTGSLEEYDEWIYQMMFKSTWNGISMLEKPSYSWKVAARDTSDFWSDRNKSKLKTTAAEPVSGGEMWTFSNGMRIIYKKMATGDRFSFSMMIKGGFSTIRDLKKGEGAFFSDMLRLHNIAGMSGEDFLKVLQANGIDMEFDVGATDIRLFGTAPKGRYPLVMKALLSLANDRKGDAAAFDAYRNLELSMIQPAVLDSLMYQDYYYSEIKTPSGLTPTALSDAESFFSKEFLRCNDGVIVIVGDLPSEDLQKYLAKSIGGFRVSRTVAVRQPVSYRMRKGVSTYTAEGPEAGITIGMAAAHPFTTESYMAFRIASLALKRRLSGTMAEQGFSVSMSQRFETIPQEAVEIVFKFDPVPDEGLPKGLEGGSDRTSEALLAARKAIDEVFTNPVNPAELASCKSLLANEYTTAMADPGNYADAILMRYSAGKDVLTGYADKIKAVSADKVKEIFGSLSEGMRIEYVAKPQE